MQDLSDFGHKPHERVARPGRRGQPSVRTRVARDSGPGLRFEPEPEDGQRALLAEALRPSPAATPGLAFEAEPGDAVAGPAADDLGSLLELAAGRPEASGPPAPRGPAASVTCGPAPAAAPREEPAPFSPEETALAAVRGPPLHTPVEALPKAGPERPALLGGPKPRPRRRKASWVSVFLSEKVLGRRRRRSSTALIRRSAQFRAAADRALARAQRRLRRAFRKLDSLTRRARLPLANLVGAAVIASVVAVLGAGGAWVGTAFGACTVLSLAGQPARNLLGYAGILILAVTAAEVIRQRERFIEIFTDLFG